MNPYSQAIRVSRGSVLFASEGLRCLAAGPRGDRPAARLQVGCNIEPRKRPGSEAPGL